MGKINRAMRRVVVVGTSGSGKSMLARAIALRLGVPHAELDAMHWGPDWTPHADFADRVRDFVAGDAWVLDGAYSQVRHLVWPRADTIVWLDYPMSLVFGRVLRRTARRWWYREVLWNGNRERFWTQVATRDSLLLWVINTWRRRRAEYPKLLASPDVAHARRIRLCSPEAAERWLATVPSPAGPGMAGTPAGAHGG